MPFGSGAVSSWRLVLVAIVFLAVLPIFWASPRQRIYASWSRSSTPRPSVPLPSVLVSSEHFEGIKSLPTDDFKHTRFFRALQDNTTFAPCNLIEPDTLDRVIAIERPADEAIAYHFSNGSLFAEEAGPQPIGSAFCLLFLIPQPPWDRPANVYRPQPIEQTGPDAIIAELASADVRFVFTDHPVYWGTIHPDQVDLAIYAAPYVLNQPGTYHLSANVEFQNYEWTFEEPIMTIYKTSDDVRAAKDLTFAYSNVSITGRPSAIVVKGEPLSRPHVNCFQYGLDDLKGRWYRADAFKADGNQTALNPQARLHFAEQTAVVDEFGWTFAPDACSLSYFSSNDHLTCFADRNVQFLGDSNLRRLLKAFVSGGDKWCMSTGVNDKVCQCKDGEQTELVDANDVPLNASRFSDAYGLRATPITWGRNSRVFFDFVGGLVNPVWGNDWAIYFNGSEVDPQIVGDRDDMTLMSQRVFQYGKIDVVLISLIVWDVAGAVTPAETLSMLPAFREKLFATHSSRTRFVIRLSNSVCGGTGNSQQRFSAPRFQMWNTAFKEFWARDFESGKVMFYDASLLSGRADVPKAIPCGAPHLPCGQVRIEDQIFLNTVCNKPIRGAARMRDWSHRASPPRQG